MGRAGSSPAPGTKRESSEKDSPFFFLLVPIGRKYRDIMAEMVFITDLLTRTFHFVVIFVFIIKLICIRINFQFGRNLFESVRMDFE